MTATILRERVTTPSVPEPAEGLWSNCIRVGKTVYVAGLVAYEDGRATAESAEEQADYIFASIQKYMESAGGQMSDLVTMTVYLTDLADRPAVLKSRQKFFKGDFPCSTLIVVSALIDPTLVVEINAVGVIGSSKV